MLVNLGAQKKGAREKTYFFTEKNIDDIKIFKKKISFFFADDIFIKVCLVEIRKICLDKESSTNKMAKSFIGRFVKLY